ncbi:UNVERIFIED_ORG: type 1 fimbria pilin [Buttiauxella agrestis ATCC 33320]
MKKTFKLALLSSLLLSAAGSFAAAPSANMTFTGVITPTVNNCSINAPATLDLGAISINDIVGVEPASEFRSTAFTVNVAGCTEGQHVQIHLNATPDSRNQQMLANSEGSGSAVYAGVAVHEHVGGAITLIDPSNGAATEDVVDESGNVSHAFTASITPVSSSVGVAPGTVSVAATLTLEAI